MTRKIHDLLAYDRIKIIQDDELFSFSIDCLLLADFVKSKDAKKIMDFCTGNAPIPLYLTLKSSATIYACDIQEKSYELARDSVKLNNLEERIKVFNADLKDISKKGLEGITANSFDIVIANPPYFPYTPDSHINLSEFKSIARHEIKVNMDDIIKEASRLLIDGGSLYLIYRVERIDELFIKLNEYNFGIKDIRFCYPKEGEDALLVLVEAKKNKGKNIKILKPLYINDENGYTKDILDIFYIGKER